MRRKQTASTVTPPVIWTPQKAKSAMGLITRVLDDIRSVALDQTAYKLRLNRMGEWKGKPDRAQLIGLRSIEEDLEQSKLAGNQLLEEALEIGLHPVDPVQGIAALPCMTSEGLGFLVIDRFAEEPLAGWRLAKDPPGLLRDLNGRDKVLGVDPLLEEKDSAPNSSQPGESSDPENHQGN